MQWEKIDELTVPSGVGIFGGTHTVTISRAKVPGGWLIFTITKSAEAPPTTMTFYPDPDHTWNGGKA